MHSNQLVIKRKFSSKSKIQGCFVISNGTLYNENGYY